MNLTDIIALALRNLRQAKLRTALTVIGVVIGVAALITMVSFGLGLQQNIIARTFARFDVFTSITVFGASADALIALNERRTGNADEEVRTDQPERRQRALNDEAVAELSRLSGVQYVLPALSFQCYVRFENRTRRQIISGAPASVDNNPRFRKFLAGHGLSGNDTNEIIVSEEFFDFIRRSARKDDRRIGSGPKGETGPFLAIPKKSDEERGAELQPEIGKEITLLTLRQADAEPESIFGIPLLSPPEQSDEPQARESQFEEHHFRIVGVLPKDQQLSPRMLTNASLYVPMEQARRFREANRPPMERMGQALAGDSGYPSAEVRVSDPTQVRAVQDEIEKLGFRSFSLNNQVDEIRRVFLIVNGGLALIGGIALLVASFGIANTMIMSILERTREIGIMKAIGGSDSEIMRIFFFEASLIGLMGGVFGVVAGWAVDRVANYAVNRWMVRQTWYIEFFSIPWYLWSGAILFAIAISLIAAIYPALRASRVDPIRALRHD
ncbi:MAG TPA: FtsX-like permease family protein [Blastocatellia bacterium]|nr:FtsX-like permease family protein [Blastocatellia bacterium]